MKTQLQGLISAEQYLLLGQLLEVIFLLYLVFLISKDWPENKP